MQRLMQKALNPFVLLGCCLLLWAAVAWAAEDEDATEVQSSATEAADSATDDSGGEAQEAAAEEESSEEADQKPLIEWNGESPHWQAGQPFAAVQGAGFIGSQECLYCHKDMKGGFLDTAHARSLEDPLLDRDRQGCESCHGAGGAHAAVRSRGAIFAFDWAKPEYTNQICLRCHDFMTSKQEWKRTPHAQAGLTCTKCHDPHQEVNSPYRWLLSTQQDMGCVQCHLDVGADFNRMSHHPLQLSVNADPGSKALHCTDCHDVHAGHGDFMLTGKTATETCLKCHADKGGPFRFEHLATHDGMSDGCLTCHTQHGSDNAWMHTADGQDLCLRCHTQEAQDHYEPLTCWTVGCHEAIHGSNKNLLFLEF